MTSVSGMITRVDALSEEQKEFILKCTNVGDVCAKFRPHFGRAIDPAGVGEVRRSASRELVNV